MKKITRLTDEQKSRFGEWSKKWIDIGLSTEPADFDKATQAALKAYELCNLKKPMVILRMGSPYAATVGGALAVILLNKIFDGKSQVRSQVRSQVESEVRSEVWSEVRSEVESQVWSQVWSEVESQVWSEVESQVRSQVESEVWSQVESEVWSDGFKGAEDGFNNYRTNQLWSSWGAYVSFFRDVCGWENEMLERFTIDEDLIKSIGWTWWHENVLSLSDRPLHIKRDDVGRLHCENGSSIEYRDGWALYHWHGVAIPKEWVTDKKPTAKEAVTWKNIEQRRAACEIVGWANVLKELNSKVIDEDTDPEIGTLLEVDVPDSGKELFLEVLCATGRKFAVCVTNSKAKTALQAQQWMFPVPASLGKFIKPQLTA